MKIISGGAIGSDFCWESNAIKHGIDCEICTFKEHVTNSRAKQYVLTKDELQLADIYLKQANETLNRSSYPAYNTYVNYLLQRDYYTIQRGKVVFATGFFENKRKFIIHGGTGWGIEMAKILHHPIFFYDLKLKCWYYYDNNIFTMIPTPTLPDTIISGIGTRQITNDGIQVIKKLFNTIKKIEL